MPASGFVSPYPFQLKFKRVVSQKHLRAEHTYTFLNKYNTRYIVSGHEYDNNFYAIKFHLKRHSRTANKFRVLTKEYDGIRVLNTVVGVMIAIRKEDPKASFGFLGMPSKDEVLTCTKRFKVYNRISKKYFNPANFHHIENAEKSTYLIIDVRHNPDSFIERIDKIAQEEYSELKGLA